MKTLLLTMACLIGLAANAETKSDSIIINVGAKKKVIIYGETKADLKELEKIDLNKALKEMNKGLDEMPLQTKKMVVKDYDGRMYKLDTPQVNLNAWNRFVKKTSISLHLAALDLGYYEIQPSKFINSYNSEPFIAESFGGLNNSINLGISVLHGQMYKLNNQLGFAFKKGLQYNFYRSEGSIPSIVNFIGGNSKDFENFILGNFSKDERTYSDTKKNSIIRTVTMKDGSILKSQILPTKHTIGFLSMELQPTLYVLNRKGKNSFAISPGVFGAFKLHQKDRSQVLNFSVEDNKGGFVGSFLEDFGRFNAGLNLEASYKIFHLFWRQNLYSDLGKSQGSTGDRLNQKNWTPVAAEGRIRMTTFGLRIGR
jgi:hypothetical protein